MSEKIIKLFPKFNSIQHKCKETKCKQMTEKFENMTKFILYSNQLNTYYLNVLNSSEELIVDNKEVFVKEKEKLLQIIDSEMKTIEDTVRQTICDNKYSDLKQNSSKMECHLCQKTCFNAKQLSTHLVKHLDKIFGKKCFDNNIDENLNETNIETDLNSNSSLKLLNPNEIKDEPLFDDNSDNDSHYSANMDQMSDYSSGNEEKEETEVKPEISDEKEEEFTEKTQRKRRLRNKRLKTSIKSEESTCDSTDILIFECEKCEKRFRTKKCLSIHTSRVHKTSLQRHLRTQSKKTSNNCHLCDFGNVTIQELKTHFSTEHSISPNKWNFYCSWPDCGQVFRFRTALDKHVRTHTGDLLYKCEWPGCNIQFNKQWKIVEHLRSHTGEKPFKCVWPGCDKAFGYRSSYRHHVLSHNKQKHRCYFPVCDKSYPFVHQLEEHILNVHKKDEKPFMCTEEGCDRTFATKQNLKYHMVIHNDRTRFKCTYEGCKRSFVEEKSLQKHLERPHGTIKHLANGRQLYQDYKCDWPGCEYEANIASNLKIHRMRAHTGEKPEKCTHPGCGFAAVRKFELRVHMLKHTGEMPYPCCYPNCCRRFKSQRALDTHITKNHSLN